MSVIPIHKPDTIRYQLIITFRDQLIHKTTHATRAERRDACFDVIVGRYGNPTAAQDVLLKFGGADPDAAANALAMPYRRDGIDVYLEYEVTEEPSSNLGLPYLHSLFVDYGTEESAANSIVHFTDVTKRVEHLREKLNNLGAAAELSLTEPELAQRLQNTLRSLINVQVAVHLLSTDCII